MDCHHFRTKLHQYAPGERTEDDQQALDAHARECAECARLAAGTDAMHALLADLPVEQAPADFTRAVMQSISVPDRTPALRWHERLFGVAHAPWPAIPLGHVALAAVVVLMLASAGLYAGRSQPVAAPAADTVIAAQGPTELSEQLLDELVRRHEAAEALQPLSEGEGMRLVSSEY